MTTRRVSLIAGLGVIVAAAIGITTFVVGGSGQSAFAEHAGAGGHGIQLECTPDPFEVNVGDTVTVTYVVRNAAGVPGNQPDHDVTFTLTDDWVGDVVDPVAAGDQTDTLQRHMSPNPSTFTEGVDQVTYMRQFTVGSDLLNTVVLSGDFNDEHIAQASIQCNLQLAPPTETPTNTPFSEVEETVTPPPPSPTATLVSEVLGPPTGNGTSGSSGAGTALALVAALTLIGGGAAILGYRRLR
jgi:hypothetical protein